MRVILTDTPGSNHAEGVRGAILYGYNATEDKTKYPDIDISKDIVVIDTIFSTAVEMAKHDPDVVAIVRSMTGIKHCIEPAKQVYPDVLAFMPLGNNVFAQTTVFSDPHPPIIVTCGCGDDELRNNTTWGNGLEFWDTDWTWFGGPDAASFANGWITGKMLRIYDELKKQFGSQITWWHARYLMREFAWRTEPNRPKDKFGHPVKWHIMNGYGRPNIDESLRHADKIIIPADPYLAVIKLGSVGKINLTPYGAVKLNFEPVENATHYNLKRNGQVIADIKAGPLLEFTDILTHYGTYIYTYCALNDREYTVDSNPIGVSYQAGNQPRIIAYANTTD